jgi:hypothetical protein
MRIDAHQKARREIQAAMEKPLGPERQAALDQHLAECQQCTAYKAAYQAEGTHFEGYIRHSLQARWPLDRDARPDLDAVLNELSFAQENASMQNKKLIHLPDLVWLGLVALMVILISFSVRLLIPQPAAPSLPTQVPGTEAAPALPLPTQSGPTPRLPDVSPTPNPPPPLSQSTGLFPQVQFNFANPLPEAPGDVTLYRQILGESLTPENALAAAALLGQDGKVYTQSNAESQGMDYSQYDVSDGFGLARFINFPNQFLFFPDNSYQIPLHGELPAFDEQVSIAEGFLKSRGLLEGPFRVEPLEGERGGLRFERLLDGLPVIYGIGVNRSLIEWNRVIVSPSGQVQQVTHSQPDFEPLGQLPILSAQQAWERLSSENALQNLRYAVLDPQIPDSLQTWWHQYPLNQSLDLYGYADVMTPAIGDPTPLVLFNNYPTSGYTTGMQPGQFLHIWGQLVPDQAGRPVLQINGWDRSELEDKVPDGTLSLTAPGKGTLETSDGHQFKMVDLPPDLPDGSHVEVRGVLKDGLLDWSWINAGDLSMPYGSSLTCGGGGGGGGGSDANQATNFGEGFFALPNFRGEALPETTSTIEPELLPAGTTIEGAQGVANVYLSTNGGIGEVNLSVEAGVLSQEPLYLLLQGNLKSIEVYHNLPIRIWGQVLRTQDHRPVVQVTRYEPVYPGLQVKAWLGTQETTTLAGQQVVLFTSQDGEQFVLNSSILYGTNILVGQPGDRVVLEGVSYPDESFGGYPVIRENSASMAGDIIDISQYTLQSNHPRQIEDTLKQGGQRQQLTGQVTIDNVELAYSAISTNRCSAALAENPDVAAQLIVQPIWRFSGQFEDGRRIEIQIQALPDEYLK